jgi:pimeloyl-ACP methyl ester carboxylesterase
MPSPAAPFTLHYADVNDSTRLAYVDEGSGPETLVFVHGLGSNHKAWNKVIDRLRKHYRCIALDLPGYGASSKDDYPFGMGFFAGQVGALIEKLGLEEVTLLGHSMGGQVAITLALRQPAYLERMVLVAPAGLETFSAENRTFFATYVTPASIRETTVPRIEANFALNFYEMPDDARFMVDDRLAMRADTQAYAYYSEMISRNVLGMLDEPVADRLKEIEVPTLIVFGRQDKLIPNQILHLDQTVETVAAFGEREIENAELLLLDKAGHFVQWDRAAAFSEAVRAFVR